MTIGGEEGGECEWVHFQDKQLSHFISGLQSLGRSILRKKFASKQTLSLKNSIPHFIRRRLTWEQIESQGSCS